VRVASRLIDDLTGRWGMNLADILIDCLTFPIATGQEETRRDGIETIEAIRRSAGGTRGSTSPSASPTSPSAASASDTLQDVPPKSTSLVSTVPAVRPGAVW
jgi:cobalamin-dependent methionine synthase I